MTTTTITDSQIRALRAECIGSPGRDDRLARDCAIALGEQPTEAELNFAELAVNGDKPAPNRDEARAIVAQALAKTAAGEVVDAERRRG